MRLGLGRGIGLERGSGQEQHQRLAATTGAGRCVFVPSAVSAFHAKGISCLREGDAVGLNSNQTGGHKPLGRIKESLKMRRLRDSFRVCAPARGWGTAATRPATAPRRPRTPPPAPPGAPPGRLAAGASSGDISLVTKGNFDLDAQQADIK